MKMKKFKLKDYIRIWYKTFKEPYHALTTRNVQWTYINVHIYPSSLGNMYMDEISTEDAQNFFNDLLDHGNKSKLKNCNNAGTGLSGWTVKKIRMLLINVFNDCILKDKLRLDNPIKNTSNINIQIMKYEPFSLHQQKIFLKATKNYKMNLAFELLFATGLRRSELLGLSWSHIDLYNKTIRVKQVLININGQAILKQCPKTASSNRTIPLPSELCKKIRIHQKEQQKKVGNKNKNNLLFTTIDGEPYSPNNFLRSFKNALKKCNLPSYLRVHSARHSFATNLLQSGVSISDVQHLGGWSSPTVLLDIYSHCVQKTHRKAIENLYKSF